MKDTKDATRHDLKAYQARDRALQTVWPPWQKPEPVTWHELCIMIPFLAILIGAIYFCQ